MNVRVTRKSYLVAIPVPSLDRKGERLDKREIDEWTRRVLDLLWRSNAGPGGGGD